MKHLILGLTTLTVVAVGQCIAADNAGVLPIGPVQTLSARRIQ
jgi:hypothetical protein